jgi:hypothetical protein
LGLDGLHGERIVRARHNYFEASQQRRFNSKEVHNSCHIQIFTSIVIPVETLRVKSPPLKHLTGVILTMFLFLAGSISSPQVPGCWRENSFSILTGSIAWSQVPGFGGRGYIIIRLERRLSRLRSVPGKFCLSYMFPGSILGLISAKYVLSQIWVEKVYNFVCKRRKNVCLYQDFVQGLSFTNNVFGDMSFLHRWPTGWDHIRLRAKPRTNRLTATNRPEKVNRFDPVHSTTLAR